MIEMTVINIQVIGMNSTLSTIRRMRRNVQKEELMGPREGARKLKSLVKKRIDALGHDSHSGHNTPIPLISLLRGPEKKGRGVYSVYMENYPSVAKSTGRVHDLPEVVEFGAAPHIIPMIRNVGNSQIQKDIFHPGFQGRAYWRNGINDFINQFDSYAQGVANRIVRGNV